MQLKQRLMTVCIISVLFLLIVQKCDAKYKKKNPPKSKDRSTQNKHKPHHEDNRKIEQNHKPSAPWHEDNKKIQENHKPSAPRPEKNKIGWVDQTNSNINQHHHRINYGGNANPSYTNTYFGPAAPNGIFRSGYPVTIISNDRGRSRSDSTLTNTLLVANLGVGLYNAVRPQSSYPGSNYRRHNRGGTTINNYYYGSPGSNTNSAQTPVQAQAPSNRNTEADQIPCSTPTPNNEITDLDCVYAMKILNCFEIPQCPPDWLNPSCFNRTISKEYFDSITLPPPVSDNEQNPKAPMADQGCITLANNSADPTNALLTPPPPTLAPDNSITDLDCVYAMKILSCSEISQCPQEYLHPSCLNRNISKEFFDSIILPPPPSALTNINDNSANTATGATVTGHLLCFAIFFGVAIF